MTKILKYNLNFWEYAFIDDIHHGVGGTFLKLIYVLLRKYKKFNLHPILNIELFLTNMESELGVLGITRKLVKDVVQLHWQNFEKKFKISYYKLPK
jgi:hypothetical protein